ncbi:MAG: DeoR/GlpR transcriptional regulator [Spirochaetales bacterium]|nr:DeoR/GlpR transcriptional regulator [Spirochaetales bacterium]
MLAVERQKKIIQILHRDGFVKVNNLSLEYNVSEETIRRDLQKLESEGQLYRTYGGAYLTQVVNSDIPVSFREEVLVESKTNIAEICLGMIEERDTIILDASTTALHVAKKLYEFQKLTVITNSMKIVSALVDYDHIKVLCCGGTLRATAMSFVGQESIKFLENYYADKAFVSCTSIDKDRGITDTNEMEAQVRSKMFERSSEKILIADITKFNSTSFAAIAPLSSINALVTDKRVDAEFEKALNDFGIRYLHT